MKLRYGLGATLAVAGFTMVAFGQGTTTPPPATTCTTAPTGLTALNIERVIPLANILTTLTPTAPTSVLAALAGGALEVHETMIYNPQLGTETSTIFVVPAGSPVPTPQGGISSANTIEFATVNISQILTSCAPRPSVLIVGTISNSSSILASAYGVNLNGTPIAISIGYTTDNPTKINNVAEVAAGQVLLYTASATGTLTFPASASTGGTTGGTGPTIVVKFANGSTAAPNTIVQTPTSPFLLDATGTTGGTGTLTFSWGTTANSPVAFISTGINGQIQVQFPGPGDYGIVLTVTDSAGNKATFPLTLEYTGRPQ